VLRSGKLAGEVPRAAATQDALLRLMAGLGDPSEPRLVTA
jgi:hypothetical protein